MDETKESLILGDNESHIWISEGLPPLENGVLTEVPKDPHTFVVNTLTCVDNNGKIVSEKNGVRVVLGHGSYDTEDHSLKFLNGQKASETAAAYNQEHPSDPIQMVVACSGDQTPINTQVKSEDSLFMGMFSPEDNVAYSITTDLGVSLIKDEAGKISMTVTQQSPEGGFIFVENIKDTASQIDLT